MLSFLYYYYKVSSFVFCKHLSSCSALMISFCMHFFVIINNNIIHTILFIYSQDAFGWFDKSVICILSQNFVLFLEARKTTPSPLSFSSKDPDSFNVDTPRGSHLARNTTSTQARPVGMTTRPDSEGGARGETSGGGRRGHHGRRRKNKKKKKNRKNNNNNGPESSSLPVITETETRGSS